MLEVLLGLRRDIPTSPFPLEFGDELSGYAHSGMIGEWADPAVNRPRTYTASFSSLATRKATFMLA